MGKIKLAAFDVDGVMTDGSITYDENGVEYKTFNAKDGHGLAELNKAGIITAIITGRNNGTVARRAKDVKITEVHQGVKNKIEVLQDILTRNNIKLEETAYMGDDIPDLCILEKVKLAGCPADAVDEVKKIAGFISKKEGGRGAVREFCDYILKNNKQGE